MVVKPELDSGALHCRKVELGEIDVVEDISIEQRIELKRRLILSGLELMDDKKAILVETIKSLVVEMIHYEDELPELKKSIYISQKLNYDYTYLANLFSQVTGITIEHFIIAHKIERVKELLLYNELTLTEICYKLHYSSVAHSPISLKK